MLEIGSDVYQLKEGIALRNCEGVQEYWAFDTIDGDQYSLNKTSAWILSKVDGQRSLEQVLTDFLESYDVDTDQGGQDFGEIITEFIKEGLITRRA